MNRSQFWAGVVLGVLGTLAAQGMVVLGTMIYFDRIIR